MTDITCPACGAEFDLTVAFACEEERRAFARLASVSIPLGTRVLKYIALFTPPKQRLTSAKKLKLLMQLLPDLERKVITHKGRDWTAPLDAWAQAIDQMLAARDAQRLELPMKGHGYLYAVLAGMADKHEAAQEAKREEDARLRPRRDTVQVRGQALEIGAALDVVYGGKDPALAAIEQRERNAAPMPAHLRARIDQLKKGTP
ncbi:hypothetical protein SAMN04489707_102752 [Paenacidovorax caeni]|uniref:Uncharacterized protein n=1 Tax=Paenacidovorax caeni TaxID=343013 RepID=A0A1I7JKS0_9BURK|nr:hypothetical protein [Paenacidovorax caeni]SFU85779.1 hypothetical protein SAMN04489707_102752 [Paenacidovorax caeni]